MSTKNEIRDQIKSLKSEVVELRRFFHENPELGFEEWKTSEKIESYLKSLGLKPQRLAKTGLTALIEGKGKGKTLGLRADIDALPIHEESNIPYKSKVEGKMHACGHDAHMAILLGATKYFVNNKDKFQGQIKVIFQPAEESHGGARDMIKEGCLENPHVDAIVGLHVWSNIDLGKCMIRSGPMMANTCSFDVEIEGKGGHAAAPHLTTDSIMIASQFISNAQTIISRNHDPKLPGVITFGKITGGSAHNIIAQRVQILGTIRAMEDSVMHFLQKRLEQTLQGICSIHGAKAKITFNEGYPALVNDEAMAKFVKDVAKDFYGNENLIDNFTMGGEDFAYYLKERPGCFYFVGARNESKDCVYPHHHPRFNIDEESLLHGMEMMSRIAFEYLK